jgi:plasmid stabilization system protein ParE
VRRWTILALLAVACGGGVERAEADRRAIESLLADYTRRMAVAYEAGDGGLVAPAATEREQQRLRNAIAELANEGRALRPTLKRLTIDSIEPAGRTTYTVMTTEVWDLRVVAMGTEQQVSESLDQENRLTYTVLREGAEWRILSRVLRASSEPS